MKPNLADRHVPFEGCFNFRDIGGYRTADGRTVRWGRYFRAGQQDQMTAADVERVRGLGLRTLIDLRQPNEVERYGEGPLAGIGVRREWLPVLPDGAADTLNERHGPGISGERYAGYLAFHPEYWLRSLELIGDPDSSPILVHCRVGKDRTGVLTAFTLSILGVDRETIEQDYMLTEHEMRRLTETAAARGVAPPAVNADDAGRVSAVPAGAISLFLDTLDRDHGGALPFLLRAGATEALFDAVRRNLLEP